MFRTPKRRERYVDEYPFGDALRDRFATEHPAFSADDTEVVFAGLRQWFHVCRRANGSFVAMPSKLVDDAWHEFILFTRDYEQFCSAGVGHFVHHTPTAAVADPQPDVVMRNGLVSAWFHACKLEGLDPQSATRLPALFAIDGSLELEGGFVYDAREMSELSRYVSSRRSAKDRAIAGAPLWVAPVGCVGGAGATHRDAGSGCGGGSVIGDGGGGCGGGGCGGG